MNRLNNVSGHLSKPISDAKYRAEDVHKDVNAGKVAGTYGGCNAMYMALSEVRHTIDLKRHIKTNTERPLHQPDLDFLLQQPKTQERWSDIVSLDPRGMYANRPTIAGTQGCMRLEELRDVHRDGKVVNEDGSINLIKAAVDPVWNIPGLAARLNMSQKDIRKALFKYSRDDTVLDESNNVFLPHIGGITVYFFGDIKKLADPATETAVRVHDECNGSDVFGTDICTCRPYLIFAIQGAVECAQRGGVGVVVYFRKEGRSLGEVTKFRVYNARKNQEGGDRPEKYFYQTELIAGIRDARFQEIMPDTLLWLGLTRIDWLMSMSSDKYDAITNVGITVMQRISLPDDLVPEGASVEINAKIASGYHADKLDAQQVDSSMRGLEKIRERCGEIFKLAQEDKLMYQKLDLSKLGDTADYVISVIKGRFPDLAIPRHSRMRHFDEQALDAMVGRWTADNVEKCRRLVDLVVVSVLLDAGAGTEWQYLTKSRQVIGRSEGLAVASMDMFEDGLFSSDPANPYRVNSFALKRLTEQGLTRGFQVSDSNPMAGLSGRAAVLVRLGQALEEHPEFFGKECPRPGNMVDYLLSKSNNGVVSVRVLWQVLSVGLESIWPQRMAGVRRGDVWHHNLLKKMGQPGSDLVPFHKLTQWLAYSLLEPLQMVGVRWEHEDALTALAEYRNGGLFVDTGVISPRDAASLKMKFDPGSEFVVEWRALTVVLCDMLADEVRKRLGKTKADLPLAKVLEGGTWMAGRQLAERKRGGAPPYAIRSDGTVF